MHPTGQRISHTFYCPGRPHCSQGSVDQYRLPLPLVMSTYRSSSPASSSPSPSSSSHDDRSAQIADYVEKRRQAMQNADAIKKERAREAEMRRMNGGAADRPSQSTQPPIPRSGIVRGDVSSSSSEANSAVNSRRGSRGRDSGDASWGRVSRGADEGDEEDDERPGDHDSPALHRYAKPLHSPTKPSTAVATASRPVRPLPSGLPAEGHMAAAAMATSRVSSKSSPPPSSSAALVERVNELEAAVQSLEKQQRFFLAFMETTQAQLALMRGAPSAAAPSVAAPTNRLASRGGSQAEASTSHRKDSSAAGKRVPEYRREEEKRRLSHEDEEEDGEEEEEREEEGEEGEEEEEVDYAGRHRTAAHPTPARPAHAQRLPPPAVPSSGRPPTHSSASHTVESLSQSRRSDHPPVSASAQRPGSRSYPAQPAFSSSPPPSVAPLSSYDVDESMEDDPFPVVPTFPCPSCGRKFNESALSKHTAKGVCQRSRKPFDVKAQRLGEVVGELAKVQATTGKGGSETTKRRKDEKGSKWRMERARLQEAIQAGKAIEKALKEGKSLASIPVAVSALPDDRVQCPHCLRRFAEQSADRHIPYCKNKQSRMNSSANVSRQQQLNATAPQSMQRRR